MLDPGPRYFFINGDYLTPVLHASRYMEKHPTMQHPNQPFTHVQITDSWYNVVACSVNDTASLLSSLQPHNREDLFHEIATQGGDGKLALASESVLITCTDALSASDIVKLLHLTAHSACTKTASSNTDDVVLTAFGVAFDDVVAGAKGRIGLRGVFACKASGDVAAGNAVIVDDGVAGSLHELGAATTPAFRRILGVALTEDGNAAVGTGKALVQFDGLTVTVSASAAQGD